MTARWRWPFRQLFVTKFRGDRLDQFRDAVRYHAKTYGRTESGLGLQQRVSSNVCRKAVKRVKFVSSPEAAVANRNQATARFRVPYR